MKRLVNGSYAANGAVDDMNRVAVFLHEHARLSNKELLDMAANVPELAGLSGPTLRREGAIRMSLKVAGDFQKMTATEQGVFRRIFPFYVWLRHITKLSVRLPLYHPVRTAWLMHLTEMYGQPGKYALSNAVQTGPNSLIQLPTFSPFGDTEGAVDPKQLGFSLSPAIKVGLGAALGTDVNRWGQFGRPPGQPGGYGGDPSAHPLIDTGLGESGTPGIRLSELGNMIGQQCPQTRAVRPLTDTLTEGEPVMRYPLGQIRRTPKGQGREPIPSGSGPVGGILRYLGLPEPRKPNVYEKQDLAQRKKEAAALKKKRAKAAAGK